MAHVSTDERAMIEPPGSPDSRPGSWPSDAAEIAQRFLDPRDPRAAERGAAALAQLFDPAQDFPRVARPRLACMIAAQGRTGSTYLSRLLTRTGALGAPEEYFTPSLVDFLIAAGRFPDVDAYVADLMARRTAPTGVFGFKAHLDQYRYLLARARRPLGIPLRVVRLDRRDRVAQAVSHIIAVETGVWTGPADAGPRPAYDFARIARGVALFRGGRRAWDQVFAAARYAPLAVEYEDLVADPERVVARILGFMGVAADAAAAPAIALTERGAGPLNAEWIARFRAEAAARGLDPDAG